MLKEFDHDLINLRDYHIAPYDYTYSNKDDDFLHLIRRLIRDYDVFIFATPIYWYSMSGLMKNFFDRISDLLDIEKDTGRALRGKHMGAISCGSEEIPTPGFFIPFEESAKYLGMHYLGDVHTWINAELDEKVKKAVLEFSERVETI